MAVQEQFETYKLICEGGLNSNNNYVMLSDRFPGQATELINFEPALFGGYRRVNGYKDYISGQHPIFDDPVIGTFIYQDNVYTWVKPKAAVNYSLQKADTGGNTWTDVFVTRPINNSDFFRVRTTQFNIDGIDRVAITDGQSYAGLLDPSLIHNEIKSTNGGTSYADSGGDQALDAPAFLEFFKNTLFIAGGDATPQLIAYSAPLNPSDWTAASGSGQIPVGFKIRQIKAFRDELYIFGEKEIKKIVVENTDFVLKDVTKNVGLVGYDTVVEINGDLMFLSLDGIRTLSATERIGDIELGSLSKDIQERVVQLIKGCNENLICAVTIRNKSQVRFFFSNDTVDYDVYNVPGLLVGIRSTADGNISYEWSEIKGFNPSCVTSAYLNNDELVIQGGFKGLTQRQEIGNKLQDGYFDGVNTPGTYGQPIKFKYTTPYLDFSDPFLTKTIHKMIAFLRADGDFQILMNLEYDWGFEKTTNPNPYILDSQTSGVKFNTGVLFNSGAKFADKLFPVKVQHVEGSGNSVRFIFSGSTEQSSFTIQALLVEFATTGRK